MFLLCVRKCLPLRCILYGVQRLPDFFDLIQGAEADNRRLLPLRSWFSGRGNSVLPRCRKGKAESLCRGIRGLHRSRELPCNPLCKLLLP